MAATGSERSVAQAFAEVARALQAQASPQETLQKIVDLAPGAVAGCDHAGISLLTDMAVETPAASDDVPVAVDQIQYEVGQGPCLDAIRHEDLYLTDDLSEEARWPAFSARAVAETGVRSMVSFRLFVQGDVLGALNLYSRSPRTFGADSRTNGAVFAAHAAVALDAALQHERARDLARDLASSEQDARSNEEQARVAVVLQRAMLPVLPDLAPLQLTARYLPAAATAQVGGDWFDAFAVPGGDTALVVGDVVGHDIEAAVRMGQVRNLLRALAVDRVDPPGDLLRRLDRITEHLDVSETTTCVYGLVGTTGEAVGTGWRLRFANAGHPPPLLVTTDGRAEYLQTPEHTMLGLGLDRQRSTTVVDLPPGSTVLLYTDGLVEDRDRSLEVGLGELQRLAAPLAAEPLDRFCDTLVRHLAAHPSDDVCLLAARAPTT